MNDDVRSTAPPGPAADRAALRPEIILDFDFDDGALFISLRNIGARPAHDVRTELKPPIRGLGGRQPMAELPLFRGIAFFPAGKQIRFLLDSGAAYFGRGEPLRVAAHIKYADDQGNHFDTVIQHDLEIYLSLPYRITR
ncbi:MAG TPA: hypothetical protein VKL40_10630 [Candidatus Angelobacter sp.]|nr:hypothetical protein [Candidatus Angelobacter sp.]